MIRLIVFLCLAVSILSAPVQAAEDAMETPPPEKIRIVTDQDKGTITFVIDGKAVAQISRDGLQVVDNISYGGALTDAGVAHVHEMIEQGSGDEK